MLDFELNCTDFVKDLLGPEESLQGLRTEDAIPDNKPKITRI